MARPPQGVDRMSCRTLIGPVALGSIAMGIHAQTTHAVAPHAGGSYSSISDISSGGSVASGWSDDASSMDLALRWQLSSGSTDLGLVPGGAFNSYAEAISSNGAMLAGYGGTPSGSRAFRWNGSYQVLPPLAGHTCATCNGHQRRRQSRDGQERGWSSPAGLSLERGDSPRAASTSAWWRAKVGQKAGPSAPTA